MVIDEVVVVSCHGVPVVPNVICQCSTFKDRISPYRPARPAVRLHTFLQATSITESGSMRSPELTVSTMEMTFRSSPFKGRSTGFRRTKPCSESAVSQKLAHDCAGPHPFLATNAWLRSLKNRLMTFLFGCVFYVMKAGKKQSTWHHNHLTRTTTTTAVPPYLRPQSSPMSSHRYVQSLRMPFFQVID